MIKIQDMQGLNQIGLSGSHQTTEHGSSNPLTSANWFWAFFCASCSEKSFLWDDSHADQLDVVCGIWSEH